jgi:hypothetical protein
MNGDDSFEQKIYNDTVRRARSFNRNHVYNMRNGVLVVESIDIPYNPIVYTPYNFDSSPMPVTRSQSPMVIDLNDSPMPVEIDQEFTHLSSIIESHSPSPSNIDFLDVLNLILTPEGVMTSIDELPSLGYDETEENLNMNTVDETNQFFEDIKNEQKITSISSTTEVKNEQKSSEFTRSVPKVNSIAPIAQRTKPVIEPVINPVSYGPDRKLPENKINIDYIDLKYSTLSVVKLKELCRLYGVRNYSKLTKFDLISALRTYLVNNNPEPLSYLKKLVEKSDHFHNLKVSEKEKKTGEIKINNYLGMSGYLSKLCDSRNIRPLSRENSKLAVILHNLDKVNPEYKTTISSTPLGLIEELSFPHNLAFGVYHGINFNVFRLKAIPLLIINQFIKLHRAWDIKRIDEDLLTTLEDRVIRIFFDYKIKNGEIRYDTDFLETKTLKTMLLNYNLTNFTPQSKKLILRRNNLRRMKVDQLNVMAKFYKFNKFDYRNRWEKKETIAKLTSVTLHPLDKYFFCSDLTEFIPLGIFVPPDVKSLVKMKAYYHTNLKDYVHTYQRKIKIILSLESVANMKPRQIICHFNNLKDEEIVKLTKAILPFSSRLDLVNNYTKLFSSRRFFFPIEINSSYCLNSDQETTYGNQVNDRKHLRLAYGTVTSYHVYELEELLACFDSEQESFSFMKPHSIKESFTIAEITTLQELLKFIPDYQSEQTKLKTCIKLGLEELQERSEYDLKMRKIFINKKYDLKKLLYQMFYIGMYMRRWKGPGNPYPMTKNETKKNKEPNSKVTVELGVLYEYISQLEQSAQLFFKRLLIVDYNNKTLRQSITSMGSYLRSIMKGQECIRMASSRLIGTGYHYLSVFYKEIIPHVVTKEVEAII